MRGVWWFWAESGCVLEDALRAGVVDELVAADETFLHRETTPGAEAIWKVGRRRSQVWFCGSHIGHVRHSLRPLRTLSIDRMASEHLRVKKKFFHPLSCEKFRDIVPLDGPRS
jgi:hypothetical protein